MTVTFLSVPAKKLSQSITSASLSFKLNNIKSWKRNALNQNINLSSGDFGTQAYGTFRNDTSTRFEIFEFDPTTIASNPIVILKRGLDFNGDRITENANYKLDWSANETTVELGTDLPQLFQYLKDYIDNAIVAGAADASETVKGLVEEATQTEINAGTDIGGTGAKVFIVPSKVRGAIRNNVTLETSTSTPYSLVTVAGQIVMVWVKGTFFPNDGTTSYTITLAYNGVTKDVASADVGNFADTVPFALMYTEVPGAGTHNITVTPQVGSISNLQIMVLKI